MPLKTARPAGWGPDRAGLDDLRGQRKSRPSIIQHPARAQARRQLQRQQLARQLYGHGARATVEFIGEMAERFGSGVDDRLAEYVRRLSPEMLRVTGGDRFPPAPIRIVGYGP
jgi:hypothetical protein